MRGCRGRLDRQAANKQHAENSQAELSHFGLHGADQPLVTIKRSTRFDQVRSNLNRSKAPNGNVIMEVQAKGLVKICFNHPELLKTIISRTSASARFVQQDLAADVSSFSSDLSSIGSIMRKIAP